MPITTTWVTSCRKCQSSVYYYPVKLVLESTRKSENSIDMKKRIVDCSCTGETESTKHTLSYTFPDEFKKIE